MAGLLQPSQCHHGVPAWRIPEDPMGGEPEPGMAFGSCCLCCWRQLLSETCSEMCIIPGNRKNEPVVYVQRVSKWCIHSMSAATSCFHLTTLMVSLHLWSPWGYPWTIFTTGVPGPNTGCTHTAFLEVCELMGLYPSSQQAAWQPTEKPFNKNAGPKRSCLVGDIATAEENSWPLAEDCTQSK